jgi:protein-tyrosine-phosphatase
MLTLEFICRRNAERSVIAHAVAEDYARRKGLDALRVTSSGILAVERPNPFQQLEHAVVEHFRTPALAEYGITYTGTPRLTQPREDVDLALAFEPWIASRARQRYASREAPPDITTIQEYAGREFPSILGVRKGRNYRRLIEALQEAMPCIVGRLQTDYPQRF